MLSDRSGALPIEIWLQLDLEAQPIEGILTPAAGRPHSFVGWLGLTAALEGLRADRDGPASERER